MAYTDAQIINAIRGSRGIVSAAAASLGCSRQTIHSRINSSEEVRQAYEEEREDAIDHVEGKLFQKIDDGDFGAIKFFLRSRGKERGYGLNQQVEASGEVKITLCWPEELQEEK